MKKTLFLAAMVVARSLVMQAATESEARAAYGAIFRVAAANAEFRPRAYTIKPGNVWEAQEAIGGDKADKDGRRLYAIRTNAGPASEVRGHCRFAAVPGGVSAEWTATPQARAKVAVLELRGTFPLEEFAAGSLEADGRSVAIPYEDAKGDVFKGAVKRLTLIDRHGQRGLTLDFAERQTLAVTRSGDPKIGGRLILCIRMATSPKSGETVRTAFVASLPGGLALGPDANVVLSGDKDWVPFQNCGAIVPGSALDFSSMRPTGAVAGRLGRIVANGEHFELDTRPGHPVRIYGINVGLTSFLAPNKTLEEVRLEAERLADRLARHGYNAVLLEKYGGLVAGSPDCTVPEPSALAKWDALIAAFVSRGLYISTYFDDYRFWYMPWRSCGIDRDGMLGGWDWKSLLHVHEGVVSNAMAFARNLFTHKNPHTGRSLAEDPALGWISLIGEGCLGSNTAFLEKEEAWRTAWKRFLTAKRAESPEDWKDIPETFPGSVSEPTRHATAFKLFLAEREAHFGNRMRAFIRDDLKCKALVSNMNGVFYPLHIRKARVETYDYVDQHFYVDHPDYFGIDWQPPATAGTSSPICNALGIHGPWIDREFGKPFVVTEWNYCPPNPCRGIAGLFVGAQAAFQDWAGIWRFAAHHDTREYLNPDSAYMESFNMTGDPLFRASQRATACLYLRGDMPVAKRTLVREIPASVYAKPMDGAPNENVWHWLNWTAWYGRIGSWTAHPDGTLPLGGERLCLYPRDYAAKDLAAVSRLAAGIDDPMKTLPPACDSAARLDRAKGSLLIETPRTCGGFVMEGDVAAGGLTLRQAKTPTAIWASALDDAPLAGSRHVLVSHLVDCVNTDMTFTDATRCMLLKWGHAPQLVRRTSACFSLALEPGAWTVWTLFEDGTRRHRVPTTYAEGRLSFEVDTVGRDGKAVLQYELVR